MPGLDVANDYLKRGWTPIPVAANKKPLLPWGQFMTRKPSIDTIDRWQYEYPQANIAILTGRASDLLVLDADDQGAIEEVEEKGVPETASVWTPRGKHWYFQLPKANTSCRAKLGRRRAIDVRGEGGYVVAPPSRGAAGRKYVWAKAPRRVAEPPEWLLRALEPRSGEGNRPPDRAPTPSVSALADYLDRVPGRVKRLIQEGYDVGWGLYPSRSEMCLGAALALVRVGATCNEVCEIFDLYPIGDKARERRNWRGYVEGLVRRAEGFVAENEPVGEIKETKIKYADLLRPPPGRPNGLRIYLALVFRDGSLLRTGVSVPDKWRTCEDRFEALWRSAGLEIPGGSDLQTSCEELIGRKVFVEIDSKGVRRFIHDD